MNEVNMIEDLLAKHSDEEIIAHLYKVMKGVNNNMASAVKEGRPEYAYASMGDINLTSVILKALKVRNENRLSELAKDE